MSSDLDCAGDLTKVQQCCLCLMLMLLFTKWSCQSGCN